MPHVLGNCGEKKERTKCNEHIERQKVLTLLLVVFTLEPK